jgi:excisionase family DNA binding protein
MTDIPGYLSVADVAQSEGVHPETIKRWLRNGKLEGIKLNGRRWLIPEQTQMTTVCPGCINDPAGARPAGYDDDGNLWHLDCSSAILGRYARLIAERNHPPDKGDALHESRQ